MFAGWENLDFNQARNLILASGLPAQSVLRVTMVEEVMGNIKCGYIKYSTTYLGIIFDRNIYDTLVKEMHSPNSSTKLFPNDSF